MDRIEECKKCKKPFAVTGAAAVTAQDYEDIDCPHCGDMWGRESKGTCTNKSLTPEQEHEYRSRKL